MIVVDASAVVDLLLPTDDSGTIAARLFESGDSLAAPHLIDVETAHALRRRAHFGEIDDRDGRKAIDDIAGLPIRRYPHEILLPRIWDLRHNLTAYDAAYIALAEVLNAPLVTRDRRLAGAAGHDAEIELLEPGRH